ncbi:putative cytoplasmic protein [Thermodesulfovibrio sp. N1]|uniref:hypothetical protein n=1 Tax=unclassified Thermodesulfovibrio TaxID=2645936 RepID=UPI00083B3A36|nr:MULTISPECIES: hypothetical protein [unclassified Thermodesulfovibrio]MDI1471927.1 hypothetical protein [Thermodesulfovibrio sp. 1176]ODA43608.1 putative cytoplasmic protein [Thermodesulfovibrio sp. N1]
MAKYVYQGPPSGVTLNDGKEALLFPGAEIELPEENDYVKTLIAIGYLKEVAEKNEIKQFKGKKEVKEDAS